jgi:hypothetical protein
MGKTFEQPDFAKGSIELRFDGKEVAIYTTPEGLKKIIGFCEELLAQPGTQHIHLEDYEVLTSNSLRGVIAAFRD